MAPQDTSPKLSDTAAKAVVKINDIAYDSMKVSLHGARALADEWEGDTALGDVFIAFLAWREALARFDLEREAR